MVVSVRSNSHSTTSIIIIIVIFKIILIIIRIGRRKTLMIVSASSYALGFLAIILANSSIFINIGRLVIIIIDIVTIIILIILKNLAIIHANINELFRED